MKKQNPEKQAYQAPVVRSVEFKVEIGFSGSQPVIHNHAYSMENVSEGATYGSGYFNHQLMGNE